jgi:hypothetical protein
MKVEITLKNGRKMRTTEAVARVLRSRMLVAGESYPTRAIAATALDDLDSLDAAALHALAKERGVEVHHRAGADRLRAALREAQG